MSSTREPVATGGCQCGSIRYVFYAPLEKSHVCHCQMCRRATGGVFAALAGGSPENFAWTRGKAAFFASSNLAQRGFCNACGTPLSFQYEYAGAHIFVTLGSLDHPENAPIVMQYGVESRLPWVQFCDDVPVERTGEAPDAQDYLARMRPHTRES